MELTKSSRLDLENSILFVCDIQENEKLNRQILHFDPILDTAAFMLEIAVKLELTTVITEHNPKVFGPLHCELRKIIEGKPEELIHKSEKTRFSMLTSEVSEFLCKHPEKTNVLILGQEAHICVQQTCLDLREKGYEVYILADGVSSRRSIDRAMAIERLKQKGVCLTTSESAVFELLKDSKHPKFKDVLPIIKQERFSPF